MARTRHSRRSAAPCDAMDFGCPSADLGLTWRDVGQKAVSVGRRGAGYAKRGAQWVNRPLAPLERRAADKYRSLGPVGKGVVWGGAWVGILAVFAKLSNRIDASAIEDYASSAADTISQGAQAVAQGAYRIGQQVFGVAEQAALAAIAPRGARPYIQDVLDVASRNTISPFFLLGLVNQESSWGRSLTPANDPSGTGDFRSRLLSAHPAYQKLVNQGLLKVYASSNDLPDNWDSPLDDDGSAVVIPADGLGFGRGFVQFDYASGPDAVRDPSFLRSVPMQLQAAVDLLKEKQSAIIQLLTRYNNQNPDNQVDIPQGPALLAATTAAYNHGEGTVARNIENGDPIDTYGHGENNNYSNRVLKFASDFTNAFNNELSRGSA